MLNDDMKNFLMYRLENRDEGFKTFAYDDKTGERVKAPEGNLTIGIGFNLDAGCPIALARVIAEWFINKNDMLLSRCIKSYDDIDQFRQMVISDMLYNLGYTKFAKFEKFILAIENKDFVSASREMLNSDWHRELPLRVESLALEMMSGKAAE